MELRPVAPWYDNKLPGLAAQARAQASETMTEKKRVGSIANLVKEVK